MGRMVSAIIVAAGKGTRMGPGVDKLFLEVAGRPVIAHTWSRFDGASCIDAIVLVVRDSMQLAFTELAELFHFKKPFRLVVGGKERQDSVWNGLQALDRRTEIVAIQDGARPCTTEKLIADTIHAARQTGAAVAGHRVTDSIKESDGGTLIARTVVRSRLWAVQTPQSFQVEVLRRALAAVKDKGLIVTDDTAACEQIGQPVKLVESPVPNPKVTRPEDLAYVETLLRQEEQGPNSKHPAP
jgi:2-C-methyl-D-erythritol 4-phosphate cytidylyltransferase